MSDRLREVNRKKEDERIKAIVRHKNRKFHMRMAEAGRKFKLRHPELYAKNK